MTLNLQMASNKKDLKEVPKRLAPTKETLNLLFALSGNQCAFPECTNKLFNHKNKLIANVCHIESALEGGERFNPNGNNEQRRQFDNLLALCLEHHVETNDEQLFKTEDLRTMKATHEQRFKGIFSPNSEQIDNAYEVEVKNSLIRIEDSTKRIETGVEENINQVLQLHAKFDQFLNLRRETASASQVGYDAKLDEIFLYRSNGRPQTAIEHFQSLRKTDWNQMDDREKYRLMALIGICEIDLLNTKTAAESFIEALGYQPDNIKAINFGILGYTIKEDREKANQLVEKGLLIDPQHSGIWSSKIRLSSTGNIDELVKSLPSEVMKDVEIAFELARKYREKKDYKSSFSWLKAALKDKDEKKHEILSLHATFILESIFDNFKIISHQISSQVTAEAKTAVNLYTQAWEEIKGSELAESRSWYLQNRGIAKKILGDLDGYYEDMLYAANVSPDFEVQRQLLMVSLELTKVNKAKEIIANLKNISNTEQLLELNYIESHQLLLEDKVSAAEEVLKGLLEKQLPKKLHINVLLDAYGIYMHLGNFDKTEECVIALEGLIPNDLSTMTLRARIDDKLGKTELKAALLEVKSKVTAKMPEHEIQILAEDLARCKCYHEAAELYELIVDKSVYSPLMEKLLHYYNIIGENAKILTLAQNLLDKYGPIRLCSEMVSYVYERIRDEEKAIETCKDYLQVYPDDQQMRLRLALIYDRERKSEPLKLELDKFEHMDKNLSMVNQFTVARLMLKVGLREQARVFVYETRRQFYDRADAHECFFAFHLDEEKLYPTTKPLSLDTVSTNSVVSLKIGSNTVDFILEDRIDGADSRGERSIHSFEGKALMGRRVGDMVAVHPTYIDHHGEVLSISPKFDFAIRESIRLIGTVFANQSTMRTFQFPESGDPVDMRNALFDILEKHGGNDSTLKAHYQSGNFPIGAIAELKGKNPIEIWMEYANDPQMGVHSMVMLEDFESALQLLEKGNPFVFEIVGLLTLFQLNLHEIVQNLPNRRIVLKSTFDHVKFQLEEFTKLKGTQIINLLRVGDELIREITTKEDIDEHIAFLEQLTKWISDCTEVVPCEAALKMNWNEKQNYDDTLGESSIDAILTAEHMNGLLFAEESSVRSIAKSETTVEGICTFQLVFGLYRLKLISFDEYQEFVFTLIQLNQKLIPVTIGILSECAAFTRNHLVAPLTTAIKGLSAGNLTLEHAMVTAAGFIMSIYSKSRSHILEKEKLKEKIVVNVLDALCMRYERAIVNEKLTENLSEMLLIVKNRNKVLQLITEYFES